MTAKQVLFYINPISVWGRDGFSQHSPSVLFCPLLKKIFMQAKHEPSVSDAPMKKIIQKFSFTPFQSTFGHQI